MYEERRGAYRVLLVKPEGKNHLEDPSVDGRRILRRIFRKWNGRGGVMDWIDLAQDRDSCLVPVNSIMNLRVP